MVRLGAPLIVVTALLAADAYGQTASTNGGAINGRVTDATGAVLPHVTVTISGDALMGTQSAVTTEEGLFRFPVVPPGEYTLAFALDGFENITQRAFVTIGFTATVNAELGIASVKDSVVVERRAPVVDRQSTAVSTSFTAYQLGNLPGARSMGAILAATPAVQMTRFDVGGNTELTGIYGAYGTFGQNRPTVEGITMSGLLPYGVALDFGSFEEVSVGTGAHNPEWGLPGVQMQFIAKSGGNRYRATLYADYENRHWQSFNIDADQIARGARGGNGLAPRDSNRMWSYRDVNADVGGYVKKDVIWWYTSVRDQDVSTRLVNFPVKPYRTHISNITAKTTYRVGERDKVIAFAQAGRNHQPNRLGPFGPAGSALGPTTAVHEAEDSTSEQLGQSLIWKGEWNRAMTDNVFLEVRAGQFDADRPETPNGTGARFEDIDTLMVRGGSRDWQENVRRGQVTGALNYFKDDWFGHHLFKIGVEGIRSVSTEIWNTGYPDDVLHVLRNGDEVDVYLFEAPSRSDSGLWIYSAYANDSWQPSARLSLNVGLRFDRYRVFLPEQTHPVGRFNPVAQTFPAIETVKAWNLLAPRIGTTVDLTGDGNTVAKFSYGRYWVAPGTQLGFNANPNSDQWWKQYRWSDANGNGVWDEGEQQGRAVRSRGGVSLESLDPNLELSFVDEVAGWLERELASNTGLRTGVVWRRQRQNYLRQNVSQPFDGFSVAIPVIDPGANGEAGTADDGTSVTAFELGPTFEDLPPDNTVRNVTDADSRYWTWEITGTRRFTGRWSFVAGFAHTWYGDQASAYLGQSVRSNLYPLTPNDLTNAGPNGQHRFRMWSAKIHGTYAAPWGVRITPYLRHQSGQAFGRTFATSLNIGTVRILAEPIGTRRMDNIIILDVRLEKGFRVSRDRRVAVFLDLFNLFNSNAEQNLNWSSGPSFLRPLSIVSPRIARIGAKVEW